MKKKKILFVLSFLALFSVCSIALKEKSEIVYGACTKSCGSCGGWGYTEESKQVSGSYTYMENGSNKSFQYYSYKKYTGCSSCGGKGTKYVYYSSSNYSGTNKTANNSYSAGSGTVAASCTWPGSYSFTTSNGITDGMAYKNCTKCGARLETKYGLWVSAGTGIASASGTDWYSPGASAYVTCTPKTGYTFSKWSDGDTRQSWNTTMDKAKSFTAYGKANTYSVTYKGNENTGGSTADSSHTYDAEKALTTNGFTKKGYTFSGWNTKADGSGTAYSDGEKVKNLTTTNGGTITLYAQWKPSKIKLTFDKGGGAGGTTNIWYYYGTNTFYSNEACTTKITAITRPTKTGYTLVNFHGDGSCGGNNNENYVAYNGIEFAGDLCTDIYKDATLYAQWEANKYDLTISPNGGIFLDETTTLKTINEKFIYDDTNGQNLEAYIPARKGYTFEGFYTAISGGEKVYDANGLYIKGTSYWNSNGTYCYAGNMAIYARWLQNQYTITYDANGGSTKAENKTFYYNDDVDLSISAEKDGMIFVGWSLDPDGAKPLESLVMPEENLTLYAVYSIFVSDVANHTYPNYIQIKEEEVYFKIWEKGNEDNYKIYPLSYVKDVGVMTYKYILDATDISSFIGGIEAYCYQLIAFDNAGNERVLYGDEGAVKKKYMQTVEHYKYDFELGDWLMFATTSQLMKAGDIFLPQFIEEPIGYYAVEMKYPNNYEISNGTYEVREEATSKAYYEPISYKLIFDANGGTINGTASSKKEGRIKYGDRYGRVEFKDSCGMPTPQREGYTFVGWWTEKVGGEQIKDSSLYQIAEDSTIYAHWDVNVCSLTYDYRWNGGNSVSISQRNYDYGSEVDLSVTADKEGWIFVGWNTDPRATEGLKSYQIKDEKLTLYAIYKKIITLSIIEQTDSGKEERKSSKTIYNRETEAKFLMQEEKMWKGWTLLGWTTEANALELPLVGAGGIFVIDENTTLYGLYQSQVRLSYDTNGAALDYGVQTKDCHYNASGSHAYPVFTVRTGPVLENHSFVNWKVKEGSVEDLSGNAMEACMPKDNIQLKSDAKLIAVWDAHPVIEAYNRYFTLEDARAGKITEKELLKKVIAKDAEDGILENGVDVFVKDFQELNFSTITADVKMPITYEAKDSFGNTVTKTVVVTITDTTMKKSSMKTYIRFISLEFFWTKDGDLLGADKGGVEETSIWRNNEYYRNLLLETLQNRKINGEWEKSEETYMFTYEELKEIKNPSE